MQIGIILEHLACLVIYTQSISSTLQNVALNKPAYMPSQENDARVPGNAVDGQFSTGNDNECITTDSDGNPSPWWKVDLLHTYLITSVLIQTSGIHTKYFQRLAKLKGIDKDLFPFRSDFTAEKGGFFQGI